jgi:hypothetical protein
MSRNGNDWKDKTDIVESQVGFEGISWHDSTAYGFGVDLHDNHRHLRLYSSEYGQSFQRHTTSIKIPGGRPAGESPVVFQGDTAYTLLRRLEETALLGTSEPPYTEWQWHETQKRAGGPELIKLPDGRLLSGMRLYEDKRTSLSWVNQENGKLIEILELPSDGDTGYPGMIYHSGGSRN